MVQRTIILLAENATQSETEIWKPIGSVTTSLSDLLGIVKDQAIDLIIVDGRRTDINRTTSGKLRRNNGLTEIWLFASHQYAGAHPDFIDGIVDSDLPQSELVKKVKQILAGKDLLKRYAIVSRSAKMKGIAETIERIAPTDVPVLVVGPSGSGKELVARALHNDSPHKDRQFVAINVGALAEGVLESELFGHEKGAFTGSVGKREGLFHKAEGGSIFLDEIGEMKPDMQVKLLRVLEDGTYYPVGSSTPQRASVRVISATNRDLTEAIEERQFREDLYFRIGVVKIILPPLMDRKEDIQPLLKYFWQSHPKLGYTDSALERLTQYSWPGNIRQLRNFAERMIAFKPVGLVDSEDVEAFLAEGNRQARNLPVYTGKTSEEAGQELIYRAILSLGNEVRLLRDLITAHIPADAEAAGTGPAAGSGGSMELMERELIERTLSSVRGNRKEAARRLGIGERTLYRKIKRYNLN